MAGDQQGLASRVLVVPFLLSGATSRGGSRWSSVRICGLRYPVPVMVSGWLGLAATGWAAETDDSDEGPAVGTLNMSGRVGRSDHDAGRVAMNRDGIAAVLVDGRGSPHRWLGAGVLGAGVTLVSRTARRSSAGRLRVVFVTLVCCAVWVAPAAAAGSYRSAGGGRPVGSCWVARFSRLHLARCWPAGLSAAQHDAQ